MIWALLFAYIFMMFGGDEGLAKDISKAVNQHVQDEARAEQIIDLNKAMMKEEVAFAKEVKKARQALTKLNRNRLTPGDEFQAVFTALEQQRADIREKLVDGRFRMKELITAEEWSKVFTDDPVECGTGENE